MGGKARDIFGTVLGLGALLASGGALGPVIGAYSGLLTTTAVAYGAWAAKEARRKAEQAAAQGREARKTTLRGGAIAKYIVYGRDWVPGVVVGHREPQSKADPYFWLVLALPVAHKIESIEQIWFGDERITPLTADGSAVPGPFNKEFVKTTINRNIVPASRIITVEIPEEDRMESIDIIASSIRVAITRPEPTIVTGDDTWQDIVNPDAVGTKISATQIRLDNAEPGLQYTVTFSYKFTRAYIKCWQYFGDDEQVANQPLIDATAHLPAGNIQKWTASDKLNGIPYVVFRFHVDKDVFPNLLENIAFQIQGKRDVHDPRPQVARDQWTDNSALCIRDYAVNECGVHPAEISLPHFWDQVNYCDIVENITLPDGSSADEYMYRTNIALSTEAKPIDNLGLLLSSCDGTVVASGSSFDIRVGCYEEPIVELDDSDFAGPPEIIKGLSVPELFNGVRSRYQNSAKPFWPMEDAPAYISEFYKERQQIGEQVKEIDLKGTASAYMAHRINKQTLLRAMQGLRVRALFNTKVMRLAPEQTVWLSSRALGMESKVFRIKAIRPNGLHQYELEMVEDSPLLYEWDFDEAAGVDPAPNTNLPKLRNVPLVQGLGAYADQKAAVIGLDGNLVPCCVVFWSPVTDMYVLSGGHIELRYKRTQDTHWTHAPQLDPTTKEYRFPIQRGDVLLIEVRLANALYKGDWTQIKRTTEDTPAPYIVSANLLPNARLKVVQESEHVRTLEGWTQYYSLSGEAASVVTDVFSGNDNGAFPIFDGSVLLNDTFGQFAGGYRSLASSRVKVIPGKQMVLFCQVYGDPGRTAYMRVRWWSASGASAGETYSPALVLGTNEMVARYLATKRFPTLHMFVRPPSTAIAATVDLIVAFTLSDIGGVAWWQNPFFGEAAEGQVSLPPWRA